MKKKIVLTSIIALSIALVVAVGVTVAYLFVKSDSVVNTFTPSDITIKLEETERAYKMIPGSTLPKDPKVTVESDINCYVFIKVEKANDPDTYLDYEISSDWVPLSGVEGVYCYKNIVSAGSTFEDVSILDDDQVIVKNTVTKEMMKALYNDNGTVKTEAQPKLTFTAYAVQSDNVADAAAAWNIAIGATNP